MVQPVFHKQTRFGGIGAPVKELGDCDKTCLATLIGVHPSEIPDYQEFGDKWWRARDQYLFPRGWVACTYAGLGGVPDGLCIAVGKSPRGEWNHSVLAWIENESFCFVHDPHPSDLFCGAPIEFTVVYQRLTYVGPDIAKVRSK